MKIILSKGICKAEFGGAPTSQDAEVLLRSANIDLATAIKGEGLPKGTRLLKVYATSTEGARRIVHLLVVDDETLFLLFYRDKKDKVGANISLKNPAFKKQLHKHLDILASDIAQGDFEELG